jgi:hypothetical protein
MAVILDIFHHFRISLNVELKYLKPKALIRVFCGRAEAVRIFIPVLVFQQVLAS